MLSNDNSWFQLKNRRLLLDLIAVLNHLKKGNTGNSELGLKIEYIKSTEVSSLERVFLSPEGRQWIYFIYSEVKNAGKPNPLIQDYVAWLGINREDGFSYLVGKLDEFIFALFLISGKSGPKQIKLDFNADWVVPGMNLFSKGSKNCSLLFNPDQDFQLISSFNEIRVRILNDSSPPMELIFEKFQGSSKYPFCIDLYSEVSRINIQGREHLPRISPNSKELIARQVDMIEKALAYIKVFDQSIEGYFKEVPNYFVPLKAPEGALPSSSNSSIDTMFWYSVTDQPLLMAEMIIHEYSHQRLFRLQDIDPLIDPVIHGSGWERCEIYSPWRDDPRPINGVFHGFVVFTEASRFWMALIKNGGLNDSDIDISKRRMAMLVLQLNHARESLRQCTFTSQGEAVFSFYDDTLAKEMIPYIEGNKLSNLQPFFMEYHDEELPYGSSILEVVSKHKTQWLNRNGQFN